MNGRKIDAMHAHFGTCEGVQCKGCRHLISGEWHDRRYHKCELYGLSHSEATDWRLSYQALRTRQSRRRQRALRTGRSSKG